eukprot:5484842-Prymnesium_polylepis.1
MAAAARWWAAARIASRKWPRARRRRTSVGNIEPTCRLKNMPREDLCALARLRGDSIQKMLERGAGGARRSD